MKLFDLLIILPPEIVNIIYIFTLREEKFTIISYIVKQKIKYNNIIKTLLYNLLNESPFINEFNIIENNYYNNLKLIYDNISNLPKKYNRDFWCNYCALLSYKLMKITQTIQFYPENRNKYSILLKKTITIWFKICTKYNFTLEYWLFNIKSRTKSRRKKKSLDILKINNFENYYFAPSVYINLNQIRPNYNTEASLYLQSFYLKV